MSRFSIASVWASVFILISMVSMSQPAFAETYHGARTFRCLLLGSSPERCEIVNERNARRWCQYRIEQADADGAAVISCHIQICGRVRCRKRCECYSITEIDDYDELIPLESDDPVYRY